MMNQRTRGYIHEMLEAVDIAWLKHRAQTGQAGQPGGRCHCKNKAEERKLRK